MLFYSFSQQGFFLKLNFSNLSLILSGRVDEHRFPSTELHQQRTLIGARVFSQIARVIVNGRLWTHRTRPVEYPEGYNDVVGGFRKYFNPLAIS